MLRDPRVTTTLVGASSPEQIRENVGALANLDFSADELAEIDRFAVEGGVNLWDKPSTDQRRVARRVGAPQPRRGGDLPARRQDEQVPGGTPRFVRPRSRMTNCFASVAGLTRALGFGDGPHVPLP